MSKYLSKKCIVDGITFDSKREAKRYTELRALERTGEIDCLCLQVPFELVPAQYAESTKVYKRGPHKGEPKPGKCIERPVQYIADFVYTCRGKAIVEDVKGMRTKDYIIKRKLFRWRYGKYYEFREVE